MSNDALKEEVKAAREKEYGPATAALTNIGLLWTAALQQAYPELKLPHPLGPEEVARMFQLAKVARLLRPGMGEPAYRDNHIDVEVYGELAARARAERSH